MQLPIQLALHLVVHLAVQLALLALQPTSSSATSASSSGIRAILARWSAVRSDAPSSARALRSVLVVFRKRFSAAVRSSGVGPRSAYAELCGQLLFCCRRFYGATFVSPQVSRYFLFFQTRVERLPSIQS